MVCMVCPVSVLCLLLACLLVFSSFSQGYLVPVEGNWSPWSSIAGPCDKICGVGKQKRYRSCTNPAPKNGGEYCAGVHFADQPCNSHACQLPAGLAWSGWSNCTNTCGRGRRTRHTLCGVAELINITTADTADTVTTDTAATTETTTTITTTTTTSTTATATTATTTTTITTTTENTTDDTSITKENTTFTNDNSTTTPHNTTITMPNTTDATTESTTASTTTVNIAELYDVLFSVACQLEQLQEEVEDCNTWVYYPDHPTLWNHTNCPDPCNTYKCPKFSLCNSINSTREDAVLTCLCQMGMVMRDDGSSCIKQGLFGETERPVPTLPTAVKKNVTIVNRVGCVYMIFTLLFVILLFFAFRVFDILRIIQLNEEVALLCGFSLILADWTSNPQVCILASVSIHFFFTAAFTFFLLEATHMYSLVASVVPSDGLLNRKQNTMIGWVSAAIIVVMNMAFHYKEYGSYHSYLSHGSYYHCWLDYQTGLMYGQMIPFLFLTCTILVIIEASGAATDTVSYPRLKQTNKDQLASAKFSQRTLLIITPMTFVAYILGSLAEYEQNIGLYGSFTILSGVLGWIIATSHISCNETVRHFIGQVRRRCCAWRREKGEKDQA